MRPKPGTPTEEKREAYEEMRKYLWARKSAIFGRELRAPCLKHPGGCPLAWKDPPLCGPSARPLTINVSGTQCA
eukprot:6591319-Lingulodinium_polyedra.AAC.1